MAARSSPSSDRARPGGGAVILAVLLLALAASAAQGAESARLEIIPAPEGLLEPGPAAEPLRPEPGQVLVCGRFDAPDFYVDDLSQLTVLGADGRPLPLTIDSGSVFVEFDQVVSLRFCFPLDEAEADSGAPVVFRWGPDVHADNAQADAFALDAAQPQLYRGFRHQRQAAAGSVDTQVASIEVIADSTAQYHFLWYLLPMGVIFLLLSVRKVRARHSSS